MAECMVTFPAKWIDGGAFEEAVASATVGPHDAGLIHLTFPIGSKVMVDTGLRLLSLANQLDHCTRRVRLDFAEGEFGAMGYLNRMGFFDYLAPGVEVLPSRPRLSGSALHKGRSAKLVEIARVVGDGRDDPLPSRLTRVLTRACSQRGDIVELDGAAFTIFAELIGNVSEHSQTRLDGFAALQVYEKSGSVMVAVSDSGLGIMSTLRPTLTTAHPALEHLSDIDLLVEVFRQGVSRYGRDSGRGCGLKGSAAKAIRFQADLDVRLPNLRVLLKPGRDGYGHDVAYCYDSLPLLWGTHICFTFRP